MIEKFSDLGLIISSRKYRGSRKHIRGHYVLFSNRGVLELGHTDIVDEIIEGDYYKILKKVHNVK